MLTTLGFSVYWRLHLSLISFLGNKLLILQVDLAHLLAVRDQELRTLSAEVITACSRLLVLNVCVDNFKYLTHSPQWINNTFT